MGGCTIIGLGALLQYLSSTHTLIFLEAQESSSGGGGTMGAFCLLFIALFKVKF